MAIRGKDRILLDRLDFYQGHEPTDLFCEGQAGMQGVALDPALNQADGIHPNAAGVREIVRRILPLLKAELDKINPRR